MTFEFAELLAAPEKQFGHRGIPSQQCSCGRFAKHVRTEQGYNGTWHTVHVTVDCSRCGRNTFRLV